MSDPDVTYTASTSGAKVVKKDGILGLEFRVSDDGNPPYEHVRIELPDNETISDVETELNADLAPFE